MHFIRVMRCPFHVLVWHYWEEVGDVACVRVPDGGERDLALCAGSFRGYPDPLVEMGPAGQALFESRPGFDRNGYADVVAPTVIPITRGGWICEALEANTWAMCVIPLIEDALIATFGDTGTAEKLLPGGEWDGPYMELPSAIVPGRMDPRSFATVDRRGFYIVKPELIRDVAYNDLVVTLRELRAPATTIERG